MTCDQVFRTCNLSKFTGIIILVGTLGPHNIGNTWYTHTQNPVSQDIYMHVCGKLRNADTKERIVLMLHLFYKF